MTLNVAQNGWCAESKALLRKLWNEGLSTRNIGLHLGCTHNAVISQAKRMDLDARPSPIKRGVQPKQPQRPRATLPPLPTATVVPFPERRIVAPPPPRPTPPRIGPASGCQWTSSNGRPWVFCDAAATDGSWCGEHYRLVFIPRRDVADAAD